MESIWIILISMLIKNDSTYLYIKILNNVKNTVNNIIYLWKLYLLG